MLVNTRVVRIEWGDCDPAGIVYYPRYMAFFDACTSALIERALGMTKHEYLKAYDFGGHPLVSTRARFLIPTRFGDDVTIETTVEAFRRSSFDVKHRLHKNGQLAVEGFETRVWVRSDPKDRTAMKSVPVPRRVIARLSQRGSRRLASSPSETAIAFATCARMCRISRQVSTHTYGQARSPRAPPPRWRPRRTPPSPRWPRAPRSRPRPARTSA